MSKTTSARTTNRQIRIAHAQRFNRQLRRDLAKSRTDERQAALDALATAAHSVHTGLLVATAQMFGHLVRLTDAKNRATLRARKAGR